MQRIQLDITLLLNHAPFLMNRRSTLRYPLCAMLCGLVAISVTGVPLSHHADHDGEMAHIEHGHGGHGAVLIEQDEQLLAKSFDFSAVNTSVAAPLSEPAAVVESAAHVSVFAHPGRDPPEESRPRAPPILID